MKSKILAFVATLSLFAQLCPARAQGTAFTYQGKLNFNGAAANGNYDLQFGLFTNVSTGNPTGSLLTNANTGISNGLFTTTLDFGNVFTGAAFWLEIGVRTNGSTGAFTILSPRQPITPAPYAITANTANTANSASNLLGTLPAAQVSGPLPAGALTGTYSNVVSFTNSGNVFSGNGSGLTGLVTPTQGNYLFATDTNAQFIATAGTFQKINFGSIGVNGGWTVNNGVFTASQSGLYLIEYQIHVQNAGSSYSSPNIAFGARGILNSTSEISGSESIVDIPPAFGIGIMARSFLLPVLAGQAISFQITANVAANFSFIVAGTFAGETYPGVALTIVRIQ